MATKQRMSIPKNWTFRDEGVAKGFDNHVREQLPWYDLATQIVTHFARHYIPEGGLVYDIGASTGNIGNAIRPIIETRKARMIALDNSPQMVEHYRGPGQIVLADAQTFHFSEFDFATSFLVMMFMQPSTRAEWLRQTASRIRKGGAMIVFDKCMPSTGYSSVVMSRLTLATKRQGGIPSDEIIEKELSLAGVQRPIDPAADLPATAFEIFRFGEFAGWIIEG
jgi:tRNA (cmo5U34)-methyltransferase